MSDADTATEATETPDVPAIELSDAQRALRDHVVGAFPAVTASGYRGELTLHVPAGDLPAVLAFCRDDAEIACELLADISAVHWPAGVREADAEETTGWPNYTVGREQGRIDVHYLLRSVSLGHSFRLTVALADDAPAVASATGVYSSANIMEREAYDLMGVEFVGHPALTRIMMPDDWEGHPHRKDYPLGGVEVMYKGTTVPPPDERDY